MASKKLLGLQAAELQASHPKEMLRTWRTAKKGVVCETPAFARNQILVVPNSCLPAHVSVCPSGHRKVKFKL